MSGTSNIYYLDKLTKQPTSKANVVFVKKVIRPKHKKYDFANKEAYWLKKLESFDRTPNVKSFDANSIIMDYMGEPVAKTTIPKDWMKQVIYIIEQLKLLGVSHNDIQSGEILVKNGKINLIDFQHATNTREEFEKMRSQGKTTVGSWIQDDFNAFCYSIKRVQKGKKRRRK